MIVGILAAASLWAEDAEPYAGIQWAARPTGNDMARAYPKPALPGQRTGLIYAQCKIAPDGKMEDCVAIFAGPVGFQFEEAGLKVAQRFRMKAPSSQQVGKSLRISIKFVYGGPKPPARPDYGDPFLQTRCYAAFYPPSMPDGAPLAREAVYFGSRVAASLAQNGFSVDEQRAWLDQGRSTAAPDPSVLTETRAGCVGDYPGARAASTTPP